MRIVAARFNHETNTFSPVPTPLEDFGPLHDADALSFGAGSATAFGAFIDYAKNIGADLITPLAATANPSGPASHDVWRALCDPIVAAVEDGCDAVLLDLHGAMVAQGIDDCEGALLERLRDVAPDVPIGVALDLHGNVSARMVRNCDVIAGFKTYPHIDMHETGAQVTRMMDAVLRQGARPVMAHVHPPILAQTLRMNTEVPGIMTDLVTAARRAEAEEGILAATVFGGFPLSDIADAGVSIVVVADDGAAARRVAGDLARMAWRGRAGFVYDAAPLAASIEAARSAAESPGAGPVLLLDHGDNCMSGGTCDRIGVLRAALEAGLDGIVAGPICDADVVRQMHAAGVSADVEILLGDKIALPGFAPGAPLPLRGRIAYAGPGRYVIRGPIYKGQACDMGHTAVLKTKSGAVLITERPHEPWDLGVFECAGLDPAAARHLILKSRMYCRPVFEPMSRAVIECASAGITASDFELFDFAKVARPVYPMDADMTWRPEDQSLNC